VSRNWQLALIFVGSLVGAGFASGQELWLFFARFGTAGVVGVFCAGLLFWASGSYIIKLSNKYKCQSYQQLINILLPPRLAEAFDWVMTAYLWGSLCVMLAGGGALIKSYFVVPVWVGVIIIAFLTWVAVLARSEGVIFFQQLLVPLMIVGIVGVAIYSLFNSPEIAKEAISATQSSLPKFFWLGFALLYVAYNMLGGVSALTSFAWQPRKPATTAKSGFYGGMLLLLLMLLPVLALIKEGQHVGTYNLPLLYLASKAGNGVYGFYGIILASSLLTTATVNTYCLCKRFASPRRPWLSLASTLLLASIPVSCLGSFARTVENIYGFFGVVGLILVVWGLLAYWQKK